MIRQFALLSAAALILASFTGCGPGKLNESRKLSLDSGDAKAIDLPGVSKPQKLNIEYSAADGEVSVFVFKEADAKGDDGLLSSDVTKALGKSKGKGETFTVDVPENTPARVIVRGATKSTEVNLKVTN